MHQGVHQSQDRNRRCGGCSEYLRRDFGPEIALGVAQRIEKRSTKPVQVATLEKLLPELVDSSELAKERVDVCEVPQPSCAIGILEKLRARVQDLIHGAEHVKPGSLDWRRRFEQRRRVRLRAPRERKDRVVQIQLERMLRVAHGRQLVAPFAVIALIVGIELLHLPAGLEQCALRRVEL